MQKITITTPGNIEVEYRLAGVSSRLAATIIDLVIQFFAFLLVACIPAYYLFDGLQRSGVGNLLNGLPSPETILRTVNGYVASIVILMYFIIYFGYFVIFEATMNGQTPGKKLLKLRVIRENGQPIGLTQSLIRNLLRYFIDIMGIGVVSILFSKKCKRLGDIAASTIVVSENPTHNIPQSLRPQDIQDSLAITGISIKELSSDEYYLLKEYFQRKDSFPDKGERIRQLLMEYFAGQ